MTGWGPAVCKGMRASCDMDSPMHIPPPPSRSPEHAQDFNVRKFFERGFKSIIHDSYAISVAPPGLYADRFLDFMVKQVRLHGLACAYPLAVGAAACGAGEPGRYPHSLLFLPGPRLPFSLCTAAECSTG